MTFMRNYRTVEEWEEHVGSQIRATRIAANLDQADLAEHADVSVGAVKSLESGRGSTLKTIIKVVRALERTDWLESLAPPITISPLAMLASKRSVARPRQRVIRRRSQGAATH
jgi:transcriptional regulator with XRE-family HTH domain